MTTTKLILAFSLAASLMACGGKSKPATPNNASGTTTETQTETQGAGTGGTTYGGATYGAGGAKAQ
jgi:hypothetical protein